MCGFPFRFDCDSISPYSPSEYPFRFDHDVIAVRFRQFGVARDFCDGFDTRMLIICDGSRLTQLLPALGYPYSCYLHSQLLSIMAFWLMWLLPLLGLLSVLGCLYSCYPRSRLLSTIAFWLIWLLSPLRLLSVKVFSRTSVELPVHLIPSLSLRSSGYWEAGYVGISSDSR